MEKKTPLFARHEALGGKIVPFAGYLLPVQYGTGVIKEHMAVREAAGLFDVSHMGEVLFTGEDALANLNNLMTNDFSDMVEGQVRYSPMCNEQGGIVDDLIVYKFAPDRYFVVVNASNREKDVAHMKAHAFGSVSITDISDSVCELALQGPAAKAIVSKLVDPAMLPAKYYRFTQPVEVAGIACLISRTGYTGEFGYELYAASEHAAALWDALLQAGASDGLIPCGLGARDTLRLEAAMPLYGHEMDDTVTPLETGLGWAVKPDLHDFVGKAAMLAKPVEIARVGLKVTGKGIVREHCDVYCGDRLIGHTTSGTHLPYLNGAYAMALIAKNDAEIGRALTADVRGRRIDCEITPLPFYRKK